MAAEGAAQGQAIPQVAAGAEEEDDGLLARVGGFFGRLRPGGKPQDREGLEAQKPSLPEAEAERAAADVPDERLRDLATRRAGRARALLLESGADPARVEVGDSATDGAPGVAIGLGTG